MIISTVNYHLVSYQKYSQYNNKFKLRQISLTMSLVELFEQGPEEVNKERPIARSLLQTKMNVFTIQLDIEVQQVNGPYVSYLAPERPGSPERRIYSGNIVYRRKLNQSNL